METDEADRVFEAIVAAVARGERSRALQMAEAALRYLMDEPLVLLLAAEALDEQGRGREALSLIGRASEIVPEQAEVWRRLGAAMVRQGRTADALAAFKRALDIEPDSVATLMDAGEDEIGARAAAGHAFLIGFPRSGTTLLERVFAAHPGVVTLSEVGHLGEVGGRFMADATALDELAQLTPPLADAARESYWRRVAATIGEDVSGKVVIDKLPLHTAALPVISKLFPRAKVLFALRDPRDVVLSCFRRRFQINSAMFEFLDVADAATYYDSTMALARVYRRLLPLTLPETRHEALVANFEAEVRGALNFLGLASTIPQGQCLHGKDLPVYAPNPQRRPARARAQCVTASGTGAVIESQMALACPFWKNASENLGY